jgi:phage gp36-like protein
MKQHGKIVIGDRLYDAEIDMQPVIPDEMKLDREKFQQFFSTYRQEINAYLAARFREAYPQHAQEGEEGD